MSALRWDAPIPHELKEACGHGSDFGNRLLLLARCPPAEQFDLPTLHRLRKEDAQPAEVEEAAS